MAAAYTAADTARQAEKDLATAQAEFALHAGAELVPLADGTLLASRGGWFRPLADLSEARAWLARLRGTPDGP